MLWQLVAAAPARNPNCRLPHPFREIAVVGSSSHIWRADRMAPHDGAHLEHTFTGEVVRVLLSSRRCASGVHPSDVVADSDAPLHFSCCVSVSACSSGTA